MPGGAIRDVVEEDVGGRQGKTRPGNPDGMHLGCPEISAPKASYGAGRISGQLTQWNAVVSLVPRLFAADLSICSADLHGWARPVQTCLATREVLCLEP